MGEIFLFSKHIAKWQQLRGYANSNIIENKNNMNELIMFDFAAYYNRIAEELPSGCRVLECGVANGDSALYLAKRLSEHNKTFTLYMVDSLDYGGYFQLCTIYENIIKSGLGEYVKVIPKESLVAADDFNDGYLDFVFIDSSHTYLGTKAEIPKWYNKVKDDGILAGHDFNAPEVYKAVTETIPLFVTRTDIPDRTFDAERFLLDEVKTDRGYGIWECRKDFYKKLKPIK